MLYLIAGLFIGLGLRAYLAIWYIRRNVICRMMDDPWKAER